MKFKITQIILACILLPFLANAQWSTAQLSVAREELAAAKAGNKLLFAGGFTLTPISLSKTVDIYDLVTGTWSVDSLLYKREEMVSASNGTLAVFAGSSSAGTSQSIIEIYDGATGTWTRKTIPNAQYDKAITISGDKIFVGGDEYIDVYNLTTDTWSSHLLSVQRTGMAAASVGNKVLFAGGFDVATIDVYDVTTDTWYLDTLSQPRRSITAVTLGDKAYFAGGVTYNYAASNVIDIYDAATDTWSTESLTTPRSGMAATTLNNKIFFAGGSGSNLVGVFTSVEIYDVSTHQWTQEHLSVARRYLAAVTANGKAYFAGGRGAAGMSNVVDIYDSALVGTQDISATNLPEIFPNPCRDVLNIRWNGIVPDDVRVYTAAGQLVTHIPSFVQPSQSLPVGNLPEGTYLLQVVSKTGMTSQLFVKE